MTQYDSRLAGDMLATAGSVVAATLGEGGGQVESAKESLRVAAVITTGPEGFESCYDKTATRSNGIDKKEHANFEARNTPCGWLSQVLRTVRFVVCLTRPW